MSAAERAELGVLRPLSLGEWLDQAVRLYRRNFWTALAIASVAQFPLLLVGVAQYLLNPGLWVSTAVFPILPFAIVYLERLFLYDVFTLGALVLVFSEICMAQQPSFLGIYRRLAQNWRRLLSVQFCNLAVVAVLAIWTIVPVVGWLTGPGMLFFFNLVIVPLVVPVVVMEARPVVASVRRSWDLARRRFWPITWAMLLLFLLSLTLYSGVNTVFDMLIGLVAQSSGAAPIGIREELTLLVASWALEVLISPLVAAATTLLYFDVCARLEGLDFTLVTADLLDHTGQVSRAAREAPVTSMSKLVTFRDLGRFGLLSLGAGMFLVVAAAITIIPALLIALGARALP